MAPPFENSYIRQAFTQMGYNKSQQSMLKALFDQRKISFTRCHCINQAIDTINQRLQEELQLSERHRTTKPIPVNAMIFSSLCESSKCSSAATPKGRAQCLIILGGISSRVKERIQYGLHLITSGRIHAEKMIILAQESKINDPINNKPESSVIRELYNELSQQTNNLKSAIDVEIWQVTPSHKNKRVTTEDTINALIRKSMITNQCAFISSSPHGPYHQALIEGIIGRKIVLYSTPKKKNTFDTQVIMDVISRCIYVKQQALKTASLDAAEHQKTASPSLPTEKVITKPTYNNNPFLISQTSLRNNMQSTGVDLSDNTKKWESTLRS